MDSTESPQRGEVWLVALGAARTGEPGKTRPAVVVSSDELLSDTPGELIVVVPLSSSAAPSPLRVEIASQATGLERPSLAVCRAVRSIASARFLRRLGEVPNAPMRQIETSLALILQLADPAQPIDPRMFAALAENAAALLAQE